VSREDDVLRASEVGQYAYCARAWWLARVKGHRSINVAALDRGSTRHRAHGRTVEGYYLLRRVALVFILLAAAVLLAWLLLALWG
jgi:3-mercaptopyruvate sulfurtransferase SseA